MIPPSGVESKAIEEDESKITTPKGTRQSNGNEGSVQQEADSQKSEDVAQIETFEASPLSDASDQPQSSSKKRPLESETSDQSDPPAASVEKKSKVVLVLPKGADDPDYVRTVVRLIESRWPTSDSVRKTIRDKLAKALAATPPKDSQVKYCKPEVIAAEIENVLYVSSNDDKQVYRKRFTTLDYNISDQKNAALRLDVLCGRVSAAKLCSMTPHQLANPEMQRKAKELKEERAAAAVLGKTGNWQQTINFTCGFCKKNNTEYMQMQTRSADEPMTTFVRCLNCRNNWKFC